MGNRITQPDRIGPNMVVIVAAHPEQCRIKWNDGRSYKYVQCSNPGCGRWGWLAYIDGASGKLVRKTHLQFYCSDLCAHTHRRLVRSARNQRYAARRGTIRTSRPKAPVRAMFPDRFARKHKLVQAVAAHPQQCRIVWNRRSYKYVRCSYLECGKWYWRAYAKHTCAGATPKQIYCTDACAKASDIALRRARDERRRAKLAHRNAQLMADYNAIWPALADKYGLPVARVRAVVNEELKRQPSARTAENLQTRTLTTTTNGDRIMSTELRFNGRDIIFPKWLRELEFLDSNKQREGGRAAIAIRQLPNKKLLVMRVYPNDPAQRPKGAPRFDLELLDDNSTRVPLGGARLPNVMIGKIALAIRNNQAVETTGLRPQMRVYHEANGSGTVEEIQKQEGRQFCRVRWDLTQRADWVSGNSCDHLSEPNQSEAAA